MLIRNLQKVLLAVVLLSAVLATPALGQEATDEQSEELQDVLERVSTVEGELDGFSDSNAASIEATDRYTTYLTFVGSAVALFLAVGGTVAALGFRRDMKQLEEVREELKDARQQVEDAREDARQQVENARQEVVNARQEVENAGQRVEQIEKDMSTIIAITRAMPAILRSNMEEQDQYRKLLHAREAYRYISEAEAEQPNDSHLLNWKAYTLRRMDHGDEALKAAQEALENSKPGDPQKARAFYNIACYYSLSGKLDEALDNLEHALIENDYYRGVARGDPDFDLIREKPRLNIRFERITEGSAPASSPDGQGGQVSRGATS